MTGHSWLPSTREKIITANTLSSDNIHLPSLLRSDDLVEVLNFPRRLENALINGGVSTVADFYNTPNEKFIKIRNLGYKSLKLFDEVKNRLKEKFGSVAENYSIEQEKREDIKQIIGSTVPNEQLIPNLLERCATDREKNIITLRYGLRSGEKLTLEEIGEQYGLTRERIRQIQAKALKRMQHPSTSVRKPLIALAEKLLYDNAGILTDEEADIKLPQILKESQEDGSSVLDLFCDLGWIQSCSIGDIGIYSPKLGGTSLYKLSETIISVLKHEALGLGVGDIVDNADFSSYEIYNEGFNFQNFVLRYCRIDPRIEELKLISNGEKTTFRYYSFGHFTSNVWVNLMIRVLEEEQTPLHFTEITNRVNDLLDKDQRQLDVRRAHSLLIENEFFAHSGVRGTYGLASWGFRKELIPELIEESIKKAGFPLHWKQIYNYVSKYKDTKTANVTSALMNTKRFKNLGNGVYSLSEK